jgi:uncharacterized membrane protein YfcA
MPEWAQIALLLAAIGCAIGFLAGLLGIGGGLTLVPILAAVYAHRGFPAAHVVHMAIATATATIMFTAMASMAAHHAHRAVDWPAFRLLIPGIALGSFAGPQLGARLSGPVLALLFCAFAALAALQMLRSNRIASTRTLPGGGVMAAVGLAVGTLASLVGAGGGFIVVPFLTWCNVDVRAAVGTSAALGLPLAVMGTLGFVVAGWGEPGLPPWSVGYVYAPALVPITIASVMFAPLGARAAHRWPVALLRRVFAGMLLTLAAYMLWKTLRG